MKKPAQETSRILARTGGFNVVSEVPIRDFSDLTHRLLTLGWPAFFLVLIGGFLAIISLFGGAYLACGDCIAGAEPGNWWDAMAFSLQTISTIGYGVLSPKGAVADLLVAAESLSGLLAFALVTGLFFAKFARPTARVLFSDVAVIRPRDGVPTLQWRLANERGNRIVEARLSVVLAFRQVTKEGEEMRTFVPLPLVREKSPVFALSWTAMHVIDERSPLFGWSPEDFSNQFGELVITLSGIDDVFNQPVHAQWSYVGEELRWGHGFVDIIVRRPDGRRAVDYSQFHATRELDAQGAMP